MVDPDACSAQIEKVWKAVWLFLESSHPPTRKASAESLQSLTRCFSGKALELAIQEDARDHSKSFLHRIIVDATNALVSLAFARSIPELLAVISSLIESLCDRPNRTAPTYAESLLLNIIQKVGDMRLQKTFEYKEAADATLAVAMRVVGPEVLFRVLPLNLEPSDRLVLPRISFHPADSTSISFKGGRPGASCIPSPPSIPTSRFSIASLCIIFRASKRASV